MPDFNRKHNRLEKYDYSADGLYYITICTAEKACVLGWVQPDCSVRLSHTGEIVCASLKRLPEMFPGVSLSAYVIMPNHVHMILRLADSEKTLSQIINCFKGLVTKQAHRPVWQKPFYDHVIRNETDYDRILSYIRENPKRWADDDYYMV